MGLVVDEHKNPLILDSQGNILDKKIRTRGIFDMRYPNGFALSYSPL